MMSLSTSNKDATFGGTLRRPPQDDQNRFFTIRDVAERLEVATRTVRRWIKSGDLVAHRFGAAVRIAESDLNAFIARHRESLSAWPRRSANVTPCQSITRVREYSPQANVPSTPW